MIETSRTGAPRTLSRWALFFALAQHLGCGGADHASAGPTGLDIDIAEDKPLAGVTAAELAMICDGLGRTRTSELPQSLLEWGSCQRAALTKTTTSACNDDVQVCGYSFSTDFGSADTAPDPGQCYTTDDFAECTATVAELETCIASTFQMRSRELRAVTCATALDVRTSVLEPLRTSPECEAIEQACPVLREANARALAIRFPYSPDEQPECSEIAPEFDGAACTETSCMPVTCGCGSRERSFSMCNSGKGCLVAVDCWSSCATWTDATVNLCARDTACETDADCGGTRCANRPTGGICSRGAAGNACDDDGDCQAGACLAIGAGVCAGDKATGSVCARDSECATGICAQSSSTSAGTCSAGATDDPCAEDRDCVSETCVYQAAAKRTCSDRENGSACLSNSECNSGYCQVDDFPGQCVAGD